MTALLNHLLLPHTITIFVLLIILPLITIQASVSPTYTQPQFVRTGTYQPILSLKSSSDVINNFPITFTSALTPNPTNNVFVSLSGFDCLASNQFSFNISVLSFTTTMFTGKIQIIGNTYFNLVKVNYLAIASNPSGLFIYCDCYLTTSLAISSGNRSQVYGDKQKFASVVTNQSKYLVQSFVNGLKFLNNKDIFKKIAIQSTLVSGTDNISHKIQVNGNTQLQWVCLGTIVIDTLNSIYYKQNYVALVGTTTVVRLPTQDLDLSTFPGSYTTIYGQANQKFFGISNLELYLGRPYQIMNLKTQNLVTVQIGYQGMATSGKIGYLFFSKRNCNTSPTTKYSIVRNLCYDSCPGGQYFNVDICQPCHFSCQNCTNSGPNNCASCQVLNNRNPVSSNRCTCSTGFIQNNLAICPPCSNFIPSCISCNSTTVCNVCSNVFVFNSNTSQCQCPNSTFYVAADQLCATYPGCLSAQNRSNFIYCFVCDASKQFYLDNSSFTGTYTCKCNVNYVQDGSTCKDICGDGINPYTNSSTYCDDGNLNNNDGCASNCSIQTGYGCFNPPYTNKSFCSPLRYFTLKYLYAQRIVDQNAGYFYFDVTPSDTQLAASDFTYYVQSSIPHTTAIGSYNYMTSVLKIKVNYERTIEDEMHTLKITLDPYKMSVSSKIFTLQSTGVNFDLTFDQNPKMNVFVFYGIAAMSGLIVLASLISIFLNYKIAGVQLLLSTQIIYFGTIAANQDNLSIYPLATLKYLTGFNTYNQFEINKYNYNTPFLLTSSTYAEFLLNFNYTPAILVLVIFIILPLKLNVAYKFYKRDKFTSIETQQKLMQQQSPVSLKQLSSEIKSAQNLADTYVDRIYFGFSLIAFLPIVVYFSIQLGFIGKIGRYQLNSFANIILSILLLMIDFCFFILVFQDTDKKMKTFNFGSKKLKSYPYRLMIFYFTLTCIFTVVLLSELTFYVLFAFNLLLGLYIVIQNPFDKWSFEYFDSISKPLISLVSLGIIEIMSFFDKQMIFFPISIFGLMFISMITSIIRVIKVKLNRADVAKKLMDDSGQYQDDADVQFDKNLKQTEKTQVNTQNSKKKSKKTQDNEQKDNKNEQTDEQKQNILNSNQQSRQGFVKKNDLMEETNQLPEGDEDELAKIKRSLRQDLKKRRGVINKVNDDPNILKQKKPAKKTKKGKHTLETGNNYQFI